jgi:hypothetical protein
VAFQSNVRQAQVRTGIVLPRRAKSNRFEPPGSKRQAAKKLQITSTKTQTRTKRKNIKSQTSEQTANLHGHTARPCDKQHMKAHPSSYKSSTRPKTPESKQDSHWRSLVWCFVFLEFGSCLLFGACYLELRRGLAFGACRSASPA